MDSPGFSPRTLIILGMVLGAILGGWLGSLIDHDPLLGLWSASFGALGALAGIWVGYKLSQRL